MLEEESNGNNFVEDCIHIGAYFSIYNTYTSMDTPPIGKRAAIALEGHKGWKKNYLSIVMIMPMDHCW